VVVHLFPSHSGKKKKHKEAAEQYPKSPTEWHDWARKTKSILEMERSTLKKKGQQNKLWAEAVNIAAYILNRSLARAVQNVTHMKLGLIENKSWSFGDF
jgi:uridine phosphorylase